MATLGKTTTLEQNLRELRRGCQITRLDAFYIATLKEVEAVSASEPLASLWAGLRETQ